ncbi:hypothetical protein AAC387_Pa03g1008 [Persea americana]
MSVAYCRGRGLKKRPRRTPMVLAGEDELQRSTVDCESQKHRFRKQQTVTEIAGEEEEAQGSGLAVVRIDHRRKQGKQKNEGDPAITGDEKMKGAGILLSLVQKKNQRNQDSLVEEEKNA